MQCLKGARKSSFALSICFYILFGHICWQKILWLSYSKNVRHESLLHFSFYTFPVLQKLIHFWNISCSASYLFYNRSANPAPNLSWYKFVASVSLREAKLDGPVTARDAWSRLVCRRLVDIKLSIKTDFNRLWAWRSFSPSPCSSKSQRRNELTRWWSKGLFALIMFSQLLFVCMVISKDHMFA